MEDEAICKVATITQVIYYPRVSQKAASALCKDTDRVSNNTELSGPILTSRDFQRLVLLQNETFTFHHLQR